jgi:hypothetical protein
MARISMDVLTANKREYAVQVFLTADYADEHGFL